MLGRSIAISAIVAMILLSILLQTTAPTSIGPLGILFVFILMYVSVLGVLAFLLFWGSTLFVKLHSLTRSKRPRQRLSLGRSYYFSSVLALGPVMLIGMQSVGKVQFYEVGLVAVFVTISCVYIAKRTS